MKEESEFSECKSVSALESLKKVIDSQIRKLKMKGK